jgi:hypothetical protein
MSKGIADASLCDFDDFPGKKFGPRIAPVNDADGVLAHRRSSTGRSLPVIGIFCSRR